MIEVRGASSARKHIDIVVGGSCGRVCYDFDGRIIASVGTTWIDTKYRVIEVSEVAFDSERCVWDNFE